MSENRTAIRVITAPAAEPVTSTECKLDARVSGSTEDSLFTSWIAAARAEIEAAARRALINRTLELTLDGFPADGVIYLPFPPLVSVTSIKYTTDAGVEHTITGSDYVVITENDPGLVIAASTASWPSDLRKRAAVRIRYVAGYGAAASDVPDGYKVDIRGLVKLYYDYRSGWTPEAERAKANYIGHAASTWGW